MEASKAALRRYVTGKLPPDLQGQESGFFDVLVKGNCIPLGILGTVCAVLQAAILFAGRDLPVLRDPLIRWCLLAAELGLVLFSLFFFRQAGGRMAISALWACQIAFAVFYMVFNLCVLYLNPVFLSGLMPMVPAVLLGALMTMTGGLSAVCFLGYFLGILLMTGEPVSLLYGLLSVTAAYHLSRQAYRRQMLSFQLQARAARADMEKEELTRRISAMTLWDDQVHINNRKAVSAWVEAVWPLCVRNAIPVAVLVISPDGLDKVRKEKGPDAAMERLCQFAAALKPFVRRQSDFLGRYDGDTFIILYSGPSRKDTDMLIGRILEIVRKLTWADDREEAVSFSLGAVHGQPDDNMVAAQWMTKADGVLARARAQGPGTVLVETA